MPLPALYLRGIELFNDHEFFEAHEAWEDLWRPEPRGVAREFLQAMIQSAVALEHYRRSNPRGVVNLFATSSRHFQSVPPIFMNIDVEKFRDQMRQALDPVLTANPLPTRGQIRLDLSRVPRIELIPDLS